MLYLTDHLEFGLSYAHCCTGLFTFGRRKQLLQIWQQLFRSARLAATRCCTPPDATWTAPDAYSGAFVYFLGTPLLAAFANTFMTSEHLSSSSLDVRIDAVLLAADSLLAARWRDDNGPDDANTLSRFRVVSDQRGSKGIPLVSDQRTCCSTRLPPYSI